MNLSSAAAAINLTLPTLPALPNLAAAGAIKKLRNRGLPEVDGAALFHLEQMGYPRVASRDALITAHERAGLPSSVRADNAEAATEILLHWEHERRNAALPEGAAPIFARGCAACEKARTEYAKTRPQEKPPTAAQARGAGRRRELALYDCLTPDERLVLEERLRFIQATGSLPRSSRRNGHRRSMPPREVAGMYAPMLPTHGEPAILGAGLQSLSDRELGAMVRALLVQQDIDRRERIRSDPREGQPPPGPSPLTSQTVPARTKELPAIPKEQPAPRIVTPAPQTETYPDVPPPPFAMLAPQAGLAPKD